MRGIILVILIAMQLVILHCDSDIIEYDPLIVYGDMEIDHSRIKTSTVIIFENGSLILKDTSIMPLSGEITFIVHGHLEIYDSNINLGQGSFVATNRSEIIAIASTLSGNITFRGKVTLNTVSIILQGIPVTVETSDITVTGLNISGFAKKGIILRTLEHVSLYTISFNIPSNFGNAFSTALYVENSSDLLIKDISAQNIGTLLLSNGSNGLSIKDVNGYNIHIIAEAYNSSLAFDYVRVTGTYESYRTVNSVISINSLSIKYSTTFMEILNSSIKLYDISLFSVEIPFKIDNNSFLSTANIKINGDDALIYYNTFQHIELIKECYIISLRSNLTISMSSLEGVWSSNSILKMEYSDIESLFAENSSIMYDHINWYETVELKISNFTAKESQCKVPETGIKGTDSKITLIDTVLHGKIGIDLENTYFYSDNIMVDCEIPLVLKNPPDFPVFKDVNAPNFNVHYIIQTESDVINGIHGILLVANRTITVENSSILLLIVKNATVFIRNSKISGTIYAWNSTLSLYSSNVNVDVVEAHGTGEIDINNSTLHTKTIFLAKKCKNVMIKIENSIVNTEEGFIARDSNSVHITTVKTHIYSHSISPVPFFAGENTSMIVLYMHETKIELNNKPLGGIIPPGIINAFIENSTVNGKNILVIEPDKIYADYNVGGIIVSAWPINVTLRNISVDSGIIFTDGNFILVENCSVRGDLVLNNTIISIKKSRFLSRIIVNASSIDMHSISTGIVIPDSKSKLYGEDMWSLNGKEIILIENESQELSADIGGIIVLNGTLFFHGKCEWTVGAISRIEFSGNSEIFHLAESKVIIRDSYIDVIYAFTSSLSLEDVILKKGELAHSSVYMSGSHVSSFSLRNGTNTTLIYTEYSYLYVEAVGALVCKSILRYDVTLAMNFISFDDGKTGNYWHGITLFDYDMDGIADFPRPLKIKGGFSMDRYPLDSEELFLKIIVILITVILTAIGFIFAWRRGLLSQLGRIIHKQKVTS